MGGGVWGLSICQRQGLQQSPLVEVTIGCHRAKLELRSLESRCRRVRAGEWNRLFVLMNSSFCNMRLSGTAECDNSRQDLEGRVVWPKKVPIPVDQKRQGFRRQPCPAGSMSRPSLEDSAWAQCVGRCMTATHLVSSRSVNPAEADEKGRIRQRRK